MNILLSQVINAKNGRYRAVSGLSKGDVVFIPKNQQSIKPSNFKTHYKDGWLVRLKGNPFGETFEIDASKPILECKEVKLDKNNFFYKCVVPYKFKQTNMYSVNGKILVKEQITDEIKYFDIDLREIKDLVFYQQMVKTFKVYENLPNNDPFDMSYLFKFFNQFKDGLNPFANNTLFKDVLTQNKTLEESDKIKEVMLTKEQAEELQSFGLAMCKSALTDDYGKVDPDYFGEYQLMLRQIVETVDKANPLEK